MTLTVPPGRPPIPIEAKDSGGFQALGLGSAPTGAPSISSVVDNGDGTLTISGSNFGSKEQPTEILYDGGDFVLENGVVNSYRAGLNDGDDITTTATNANEVWRQGTGSQLSKTDLRGAYCTGKMAYRLKTNYSHWLGFPKAEIPDVNIPFHSKYHARWFIKWTYGFSRLKTLNGWTVTSGTFNYPDLVANRDAIGEELQLSSSGIQGFLLKENAFNQVSVYTPNFTSQFEGYGTDITGLSSGAQAQFNGSDDYGPEKIFRIYGKQDGTGDRFTIEQYKMNWEGAAASYSDVTAANENVWTALDVLVDLDTSTADFYVNGALYASMSGITDDPNVGIVTADIGWQPVRSIWNNVEFADIYIDHSFKAVYLGDAPVWGDCTQTEIQPIQWGSQISVPHVRYGALNPANPVYAFVTDKGVPGAADTGVEVQF